MTIPKIGTRSTGGKNERSPSSSQPSQDDRKGAPRIIHNDKELEAYTDALFKLTALENPTSDEEEAIELLTLLVVRYENGALPHP